VALPAPLGGIKSIDLFDLTDEDARARIGAAVTAAVSGTDHPSAAPGFPGSAAQRQPHPGWSTRVGRPAPDPPGGLAVVAPAFPGRRRLWRPALHIPQWLDEAALELAVEVQDCWTKEMKRIDELNRTFPLEIRQRPAPAELFPEWDTVVAIAERQSGRTDRNRTDRHGWAARPGDLVGEGRSIADVLARVPTGRLVILGEPGSGKSTALTVTIMDLLLPPPEGEPPEPVPLRADLASWDPRVSDLRDWLGEHLAVTHPRLRRPDPEKSSTVLRRMFDMAMIVPVLDGLDEMAPGLRPLAIKEICATLAHGQPMVLTSRSAQFREATRPASGGVWLGSGWAGIELCPLAGDTVASYVSATAGGRAAARDSGWESVLTDLRESPDSPVSQALATPLMVWLARSVYAAPPPGSVPADPERQPPGPGELCLRERFPNRETIENHLLAEFVPAALRRTPTAGRRRWPRRRAERWLAFLADRAEADQGERGQSGAADLQWWTLAEAVPVTARKRLIGAVTGVVLGAESGALLGLFAWRAGGPVLGAAGALMGLYGMGINGWRTGIRAAATVSGPVGGFGWSWAAVRRSLRQRRVIRQLVTVVPFTVATMILSLLTGAISSTVVGAVSSVMAALILIGLGLAGDPADLAAAPSPRAALIRDRRRVLATAAVLGGLSGAAFGVALSAGDPLRATAIAVSFAVVLGTQLMVDLGLRNGSWVAFTIIHAQLASTGRLPWRLMTFLDDAHHLGVLRQDGAAYQFRHAGLQRQLAVRHRRWVASLATPGGSPLDAPFGRRMAARLVDLTLVAGVLTVVFGAVLAFGTPVGVTMQRLDPDVRVPRTVASPLVFMALFVSVLLVEFAVPASWHGRGVGKRMFGLGVVLDGDPSRTPGRRRQLARALTLTLLVILAWAVARLGRRLDVPWVSVWWAETTVTVVLLVCAVVTPRRRAPHDLICGTRVVRVPRRDQTLPRHTEV
jgi:uncharacterized RDD family membrane protein YckC